MTEPSASENKRDYPRCKTCQHFQPMEIEGGEVSYGTCAALTESSDRAWIWSPNDAGDCHFDCWADFGCIQHEPRA